MQPPGASADAFDLVPECRSGVPQMDEPRLGQRRLHESKEVTAFQIEQRLFRHLRCGAIAAAQDTRDVGVHASLVRGDALVCCLQRDQMLVRIGPTDAYP